MNLLADFRFLQPQWLLLLPPLWLLILLHARRAHGKSMWHRVCDAHLLTAMTSGQQGGRAAGWTAALLGCVFTTGIIAAAAPSKTVLSFILLSLVEPD